MGQSIRISAYGLLLRDDRLLLCRLSPRVSVNAGLWTLPGGGIDFGESPEEAMIREVCEETGLTVSSGPLRAVDSLCDQVKQFHNHSIRILYDAHYIEGELRPEQDGTTDKCEWFTHTQLTELSMVELARKGAELAFDLPVP